MVAKSTTVKIAIGAAVTAAAIYFAVGYFSDRSRQVAAEVRRRPRARARPARASSHRQVAAEEMQTPALTSIAEQAAAISAVPALTMGGGLPGGSVDQPRARNFDAGSTPQGVSMNHSHVVRRAVGDTKGVPASVLADTTPKTFDELYGDQPCADDLKMRSPPKLEACYIPYETDCHKPTGATNGAPRQMYVHGTARGVQPFCQARRIPRTTKALPNNAPSVANSALAQRVTSVQDLAEASADAKLPGPNE